MTRQCKHCGRRFETGKVRGRPPSYCSPECRREARRAQDRPAKESTLPSITAPDAEVEATLTPDPSEFDETSILPEGDPPAIGLGARHLLRRGCRECGGSRLFTQTMHQRRCKSTGLPLFRIGVLCGDCGDVDERRDPDDYWETVERAVDKWCSICNQLTRTKTNQVLDGDVVVVTMTCSRCGDSEDRRVE